MSKNPKRPSTQRNTTFQKLNTKKFSSKQPSRIEFLDPVSRNQANDIYSNSRDNNTVFDIYSNTAKSKRNTKLSYRKKKLTLMNEPEDHESSRM
jgi:hypothetical protein